MLIIAVPVTTTAAIAVLTVGTNCESTEHVSVLEILLSFLCQVPSNSGGLRISGDSQTCSLTHSSRSISALLLLLLTAISLRLSALSPSSLSHAILRNFVIEFFSKINI